MKKRVVCAALVSIMTMSLAACSGGAVSAPAETKAESTEAKTLYCALCNIFYILLAFSVPRGQ